MTGKRWSVAEVAFEDRMPPLAPEKMTPAQRRAADEMAAGPRGGVKGPFIPLLRSPELMDRLQKVGEYLRFGSSLEARLSELIMLIVSREWSQHFEWGTHVPLARKAGLGDALIAALAEGRRPSGMREDEEVVYEFCAELLRCKGVSETTYRRAAERFGEPGILDITAVAGYFAAVSMIMNVAHTPPAAGNAAAGVPPLLPFPF
jgi:4-carboxymuconolactone decarboxylase